MKKLIAIFILLPVLALADPILIFGLRTTASTHDKVAIRDKFRTMFNDTSDVSLAELPQMYKTANTNIVGWRLVVNLNQVAHFTGRDHLPTKAQFDTWKAANLDTPANFVVWYVASGDWETTLKNDGWEAVPNE